MDTFSPGMLGPIHVVHKIKFKPMKILKKLMGIWI